MPYKDPKKKKEYLKLYYEKNKERKREIARNYYLRNKEKCDLKAKIYASNNKPRKKQYDKKYYEKNKDKIIQAHAKYIFNKRRTDPSVRLKGNLSRRILLALKGKNKSSSTMNLLDVPNIEFLWKHLESTFKEGMTRDNHGSVWHVDHKIPCAAFDLSDPNQQRQCFHYTNLQALFVYENLFKKDKILDEYFEK